MSHVKAFCTTGPSIATATATKVVFNSVAYDKTGEYDNSTGVFTAVNDGFYIIACNYSFESTSWTGGYQTYAGLYVNDAVVAIGDVAEALYTVTLYATSLLTRGIELSAGDEVDIRVYQNNGSSLALRTDVTQYNWLSIDRVI
jgi:hypothetical protein